MRFNIAAGRVLAVILAGIVVTAKPFNSLEGRWTEKKITPKVLIIDMFPPEGEAWYGIPEFNLLAKNITLPGASPLYGQVHCTADEEVCQIVTGESGRCYHWTMSF